jgi:ABC-type cobalt transport system substrate-binding protein
MKKVLLTCVGVLLLAVVLWVGLQFSEAEWSGVDETVVEHFAEAAGREPREPLINTDQGDLLLFVFLVAGACGGFVAGYAYRELFGTRKEFQSV